MKTTKELARELGLLRQRKLSRTSSVGPKQTKLSQIFSYLIIIDFESTCWEGDKSKSQEIIEFPAVLLNTRTGLIASEFHYYTQPQEHPTLSAFCQELTGISQNQVDNGIPLSLCLRKFSHWLRQLFEEKGVCLAGVSGAGTSSGENKKTAQPAAIVTWSDWDLGVCLHYELKRKQIPKFPCFNQWIDLRATYTKFYDRKPKGLNGALQDVGIEFEGREHSGLHDSRNTAYLAWRMIRDGCVLNITKSLTDTRENKSSHFKAAQAQQTPVEPNGPRQHKTPKKTVPQTKSKAPWQQANKTTPKKLSKKSHFDGTGRLQIEVHLDCQANENLGLSKKVYDVEPSSVVGKGLKMINGNIPQNADNYRFQKRPADFTPEKMSSVKCQRLSIPTPKKCSESVPVHIDSHRNCLPDDSASLELFLYDAQTSADKLSDINTNASLVSAAVCNRIANTPLDHVKTARKLESQSVVANTEPTIYSNRKPEAQHVINPLSTSRNGIYDQVPAQAANKNREPRSRIPILQHPGAIFKTPSPQQSSKTIQSLPGISFPLHTPSPLSTRSFVNGCGPFKTPENQPFTALSSTMRATPPLCKCGRRAKRRMVQNVGPNMGRWFFSCAKGTGNAASAKAQSCGFFQWENSSPYTNVGRLTFHSSALHVSGASGFANSVASSKSGSCNSPAAVSATNLVSTGGVTARPMLVSESNVTARLSSSGISNTVIPCLARPKVVSSVAGLSRPFTPVLTVPGSVLVPRRLGLSSTVCSSKHSSLFLS